MPNYDAEDIVLMKNRKKRRRKLRKMLVFLLVAAVFGGLYYTKDDWLPKLRGIGKQYKTIRNDGQLAEGNFPIEINGGAEYQLRYSDDTLYLLSDAYVYYYNTKGGKENKRQHAYMNPVIESSGENLIVYESGGDEFSVETADSVLYSKQTENTVMFARVSSDGYAAVVTTSENYACELTVYNSKGRVIYTRSCVERIGDISFIDDSEGCIISYIGAENGGLSTSVQKVSFDSDKEKWNSPPVDTLGLSTCGYSDGAVVIGFTACAYIDSKGQIESYYKYDGDFAGGDSKSGKTAVIINDDDRRKYTLELFSGSGDPVSVAFEEPLKYVEVYDGLAYVMTKEQICAYDFSGGLRSTADVSDSYEQFRRSEDYIFLMGYNRVDRIDYNS